ncbi:MAG TPA: TIM barrel protein [Candidatus Limnocylindria bacterium]|nr:TIM barrel protein [Candidatus Limnocylindria bacterium]
MNGSIHDAYCLGTLQWMSFPPARYGYLEPIKKLCADDFFSAVEIGRIPDEAERRQTRDLLASANMRVFHGAHPVLLGGGLNPNALDEAERLRAEKALLEAVDEAAFIGAEGMAFLAGKWQPEHRDAMLERLVKTTKAVCAYAADKGIQVNLEVFDYDVDKAVLIGPAPLAARYAEMVTRDCPNFGLLVDLSHIPVTHEGAEYVIKTLKPHIRHLHVGTAVMKPGAPAYGDRHPRFGVPNGEHGAAELAAFLRVLRNEGFEGRATPVVLSTEVAPQGDEDADAVLAGSKRVIRDAWRMLRDA